MLSTVRPIRRLRPSAETLIWPITAALLVGGSLLPEPNADMLNAVGRGLLSLLPVVAIAALLAGILTVGHWTDQALAWLKGGPVRALVTASLIGAITPVCGLGMLPLIATLLRRGLPLAPVMAFWVSAPVTDPSMMLITADIIGVPFAVAKTVAAFGIGMLAGGVTSLLPGYRGANHELMRPETLKQYECEVEQPRFWPAVWGSARPIIRWLALALVLEVFLHRLVSDAWVASLFGTDAGAPGRCGGRPHVLGRLRGTTPRQRVDGQGYELWGRPRAHDLRCSGQFLFRGGGRRPCARPRLRLIHSVGDVRRLPGRVHSLLASLTDFALAASDLTRGSWNRSDWAFGQSSETWDNSLRVPGSTCPSALRVDTSYSGFSMCAS